MIPVKVRERFFGFSPSSKISGAQHNGHFRKREANELFSKMSGVHKPDIFKLKIWWVRPLKWSLLTDNLENRFLGCSFRPRKCQTFHTTDISEKGGVSNLYPKAAVRHNRHFRKQVSWASFRSRLPRGSTAQRNSFPEGGSFAKRHGPNRLWFPWGGPRRKHLGIGGSQRTFFLLFTA